MITSNHITPKNMKLLIKTFLALPLLGLFAFCIFGFLATFEPLDPITQMTWQAIYAIAGLGAISAILFMLKPEKKI
tara:strand:+ start:163 stop:390 length:228 start_codon:yes stop_codon:yes gene_type:complete